MKRLTAWGGAVIGSMGGFDCLRGRVVITAKRKMVPGGYGWLRIRQEIPTSCNQDQNKDADEKVHGSRSPHHGYWRVWF
ncbi:hypothetical protein C5L39_10455 [Corynebacterium alimapuense]|uniref:Uncharacterized protein n=1 Tax=Corynebacterium alimapuense TaxID=1576874 RepID=A0A3M8K4M6_9CORY|nr:hypothetical protein C5L39_10455 [Corynebacterium alimapuense]